MLQSRWIVPLAATLVVAAFAPRVFASAPVQNPQRSDPVAPTYTMSQQNLALNSIVVNGYSFRKLPFPVLLQVIKKALTRPWSTAPADRNELVCRYGARVGSHLDNTMSCLTNAQLTNRYQRTQDGIWKAETHVLVAPGTTEGLCGYGCALFNTGSLYVQIANFVATSRIKEGAMQALLAKLPPANSSYTLRVMDHGRPDLDYVIKDGDLVHVYHYIYENGAAVKAAGAPTQH